MAKTTTKRYEVEMMRTNVTPKEFYSYCKREFSRRTGGQDGLGNWLDDYETWSNPLSQSNIRTFHEDWDEPKLEICRILPFDFQQCLEGSYNFIMEFNFWDDRTGTGYMYAYEA